ncbi:LCP family protein [Georgenia sp. SUBG003]|uniref:LCP family glycopolymer transferase n=1 Tax=Georgenia sp. SUBG003 TaxID=1497974 RepID=UPI003AB5AD2D
MPRHAKGSGGRAELSRGIGGEPPAHPRHAHALRRRTGLRRAGVAGLAAVLFVGSGAAFAYSEIQGNVDRHDISHLLGDSATAGGEPEPIDQKAGQPINLLVMGSDVRAGDSDVDGAGAAGEVQGMRSDTTMIAHISADRSRVEVLSIPRDTLVDVPACTLPDGSTTTPHEDAMFNSAFQTGGQTGDVGAAAACTIRTVQDLTGIVIDDFVVVDFAGFKNVVDALDGVPLYFDKPIDDPYAQLRVAAGCQVLDGTEALGVARARKTVGDGSDISRIGRQQELVAAIAREALGKNLLTDLPALYQFLDAATSTLTTGPYIGGLPTMAGLANSLRGLEPGAISFATMPFDWAGPRVVPSADAEAMWENIKADRPIDAAITGTGEAPAPEPTETATETPSEQPTEDTTDDGVVTAAPSPEPTVPVCTK